jgi:signal peptidase I
MSGESEGAEVAAESKPSRVIALLLAFFAATGTGHYYAGLRRRGLLWLAGTGFALLAATFALVPLGRALGYGPVVAIWAGAVIVAWCGPTVDLALLSKQRFARVARGRVVLFWLGASAVGLLVRGVARSAMVEAFKIPSASMSPTLRMGDHILVDKMIYGPTLPFTSKRLFSRRSPARGELIVFEYPNPDPEAAPTDFVKRVVALPGDTLEVDAGHPIINGYRVPSCPVGSYELALGGDPRTGDLELEFLGDYSYLIWLERDVAELHQGPYRVKPGETWVFGDNRHNSADSRAWAGGVGAGVPDRNVKGRAFTVWLSFDAAGRLSWQRLGADLLGAPDFSGLGRAEIEGRVRRCLAQRPANTFPPAPR